MPPPWYCQVPKDAIILPVNNYGENYLRVGGWPASASVILIIVMVSVFVMVVPPP